VLHRICTTPIQAGRRGVTFNGMSVSDAYIGAIRTIQEKAASSSYMEDGPQLVFDYASTLWSPPGARPRDPSVIVDQRIELGVRAVYAINALAEAGELKKYLPPCRSVSATAIAELAATENLEWVNLDEALLKLSIITSIRRPA
jgi:hypothetical protein